MGTLHLVVNVRDFFKTTCLLKKIDSFSRGRTLSGHTWSTAKKFLILNLSSLHPYGKPTWDTLLGRGLHYSAMVHTTRQLLTTARQLLTTLGNSSQWSDHEFDCLALFAPAWTSSRQHCTMGTRRSGTSCWVQPRIPTADHMGCALRGGLAHKTKPCGA